MQLTHEAPGLVDGVRAQTDGVAAGPVQRRPVILVVDDEPPILEALRRVFRNEPYDLLLTETPRQAIEWVTTRRVDLVIADQRMPAMMGTQLLRIVGLVSPGTQRVMLTGYPDVEVFERCLANGIKRMLTKPWDDATLVRTVGELLADRSPGGAARLERA